MPLQIPHAHPNTALHLYRHILREATYLPPLARPWTFEHVKSRFRHCQHAEHPERYMKVAHRQLRFLRAANAGHVDRMLRICLLATGRIGKRRRQLSGAYLSKSAPEDLTALENGHHASNNPMRALSLAAWGQPADSKPSNNKPQKHHMPPTAESSWMYKWDLEKVRLLAESQYERQESTSDWVKNNKVRRTVDPRTSVVKENCWGSDLKPTQMTNKLQKHWTSVLASLMPPLPQGEWDALKALASGDAPGTTWTIPPRRPVAVSFKTNNSLSAARPGMASWDWEQYATTPIRKLERKNSRRIKALSGSPKGQSHHDEPPIGVRAFKPRSLKRGIYSMVWQASPVVKEKPRGAKPKWSITWGAPVQPAPSKPRSSDMKVFQGIDNNGKLIIS
ncbi:hypothetical protein BKA67DRAFT_654160 [Truncatella angustata]|uniref:LYR motif-containing protein Cup1-like N-terminal domain-containing protein n=1 Tax=Truncatella angustata TaxID=152316 RepID=A0A9P8UYQ9_9PEZI|nr:uncharacterized protein BKA67DRAFT_654160 [Truncatella angustata]KAH6661016.1 hypothetical protein BKA67DRAFT_654160 [Truncatella angustata]KAH8203725.1 hypothetical protein TruAng_002138 [Truncatella angustata]